MCQRRQVLEDNAGSTPATSAKGTGKTCTTGKAGDNTGNEQPFNSAPVHMNNKTDRQEVARRARPQHGIKSLGEQRFNSAPIH